MQSQQIPTDSPADKPTPVHPSSASLVPLVLTVTCLLVLFAVIFLLIPAGIKKDPMVNKSVPTITQSPSPTQVVLQSVPAGWKFYKNEKLYFSISYPEEWYLTEDSAGTGTQQNSLGGILISELPPDKLTSTNNAIWVYLAKVDKELTLEEWARKIGITDTSGNDTDLQNISIDGSPAIRLIQKIYSKEEQSQLVSLFLKKENLGWVINFIHSEDFNIQQKLSQIISTIKILSTDDYVEPIEMMGSSMEPALVHGQRYAVDRKKYLTSKPVRGDIVLIERPDKPEIQVIKRIIGLPGESISLKEGKVFINDAVLDEPYLKTPDSTLNYPRGFTQEGKTVTIPQNQYFVMGDNRPHSSDSRDWGPVSFQDIRGIITPN